MFIKPANRPLVRNCLLIINILFGIIFVGLLIFGLCVVRPKIIAQAIDIEQYYPLDLNHLPQSLDTVEPDYVGKENMLNSHEFDNKVLANDEINTSSATGNKNPQIAILVVNLGLSKRINDLALQLPAQISLGVIPYSNSLQTFLNEAQNKGHEIYVSLPNFVINGEEDSQLKEGHSKFNDWFNIYGKYKGIYSSHTVINDDSESLKNLLNQITDKNLLLVLGGTIDSVGYKKLPIHRNIIQTSVIIGVEADENEIKKNLEQLVVEAKTHKKAIGYANGYLLTIEMINKWLPTLKSQGIELVPVSSIVER